MVQAYSQKIFNGQKPVFDGRKNMYSRDPLPIGRDKVGGVLTVTILFVLVVMFIVRLFVQPRLDVDSYELYSSTPHNLMLLPSTSSTST